MTGAMTRNVPRHVARFARRAWIAVAVGAVALTAGAGSEAATPTPALVFSRNGDLYAIALDGSQTVRLTNTPVWDENSPAPSPDGRSLAYARGTWGSAVWVMDLAHRDRRYRLTSGWTDHDPTWTRDGRWIYFSRYLSQDDEGPGYSFHEECGSIFRVRAHGREPAELLTNPPAEDSFHSHFSPAVSPDGVRIAFTDASQCSGGTASYALRVADTYGNVTRDLARLVGNRDEPFYGSPDWSPDGERLAFADGSSLAVVDRDGSERRQLTPPRLKLDFLGAHGPAWSPDGNWIAFTTASKGHDLYVVRPDGSGLRRLTRSKAFEEEPAWLARLPSGS